MTNSIIPAAALSTQSAVARYTAEEMDLIDRTCCRGVSADERQLFFYQAKRTGLDPLLRQIYAVKRWDNQLQREVMAIQTGIDGFRLIAERHGQYAGQVGPFWCGEDGVWKDVWLSDKPPAAAKVGILRSDFTEPCWGVARFEAYCSRKKDGKLTAMWANKGDIMIAKCAEALGLRKAFPQELSNLYSSEEMEHAQEPTKSAYQARKDGDWEALIAEMAEQKTPEDLEAWGARRRSTIHTLPMEWQKHFREEYERRIAILRGGLNVNQELAQEAYDIARTRQPDEKRKRQPGEQRTNKTPYVDRAATPYAEIIDDEIPDPDKFLDGLDAEMAVTTDIHLLNEVWSGAMEKVALLSPPDQKAADKLYMKHRERHGVK